MATLAQIARGRKDVLKQLLLKSRALDTAQEALEREVKRLVGRRKSIPEVVDMQRLVSLADRSAVAMSTMVTAIKAAAAMFTHT